MSSSVGNRLLLGFSLFLLAFLRLAYVFLVQRHQWAFQMGELQRAVDNIVREGMIGNVFSEDSGPTAHVGAVSLLGGDLACVVRRGVVWGTVGAKPARGRGGFTGYRVVAGNGPKATVIGSAGRRGSGTLGGLSFQSLGRNDRELGAALRPPGVDWTDIALDRTARAELAFALAGPLRRSVGRSDGTVQPDHSVRCGGNPWCGIAPGERPSTPVAAQDGAPCHRCLALHRSLGLSELPNFGRVCSGAKQFRTRTCSSATTRPRTEKHSPHTRWIPIARTFIFTRIGPVPPATVCEKWAS